MNSDMFQKHKRTGWIVTLTQHEFTLSFQTEVLESDAEFLLRDSFVGLWGMEAEANACPSGTAASLGKGWKHKPCNLEL